jgi:hypothetical protein
MFHNLILNQFLIELLSKNNITLYSLCLKMNKKLSNILNQNEIKWNSHITGFQF